MWENVFPEWKLIYRFMHIAVKVTKVIQPIHHSSWRIKCAKRLRLNGKKSAVIDLSLTPEVKIFSQKSKQCINTWERGLALDAKVEGAAHIVIESCT